MGRQRVLVGLLVGISGLAGATSAQGADVRPSDALAVRTDVSGAQERPSTAASWVKLLKAPKRTPSAARVVSAAGPPGVIVVSRALVAPDTKAAKKLAKVAAKLRAAKLDALDATALAVPALAGARRVTWRDGRAVAQLTVVDPSATLGADGAATVMALVRARLKARSALPAWDALMETANASDKPPGVTTALQAFELAFGPIPGVRAPSGPAGGASATLAFNWIARVAGKLPRRQYAAVVQRLDNVLGSPEARSSASGPSVRQQSEDIKTARAAIEFMSSHLGVTGARPEVVMEYREGRGAEAFTIPYPEDIPAGKFRHDAIQNLRGREDLHACTLVMLSSGGAPPGGQDLSGADRAYVIAHETFHCVMTHSVVGVITNLLTRPWLGEGGAAWAGCQFVPGARYPSGGPYTFARIWMEKPGSELTKFTYQGIGFLNLLQDHGIDPWTRIPAIARARWDEQAAFGAAVGDQRQAVLDGWASHYLADGTRGADWGPQQPMCSELPSESSKIKPRRIFLFPDQKLTETQEPWTNTILAIAGNAELVRVRTEKGTVRINSHSGVDDKNVTDELYCLQPSKCACAGPAVKQLYKEGEEPLAALTGGPDGTTVTFTAEKATCPVITAASFTVPSATFNATEGQQRSWTSSENWDIRWGRGSNMPTLPLIAGRPGQRAIAATSKGGGSFHFDGHGGEPSCDGTLELPSPSDGMMVVETDSGSGTKRTWTLRIQATSYGVFTNTSNCTPPPPFDSDDLTFNHHLWETHVTLTATGSDKEHTQEFTVAADPSHAARENWTGKVSLTGIW